MEKTLVIAGGGLAGLACGIRLAERGWNVTVHERRHYPLKKVCGEFLSPQGWRRVQSLGAAPFITQAPRELRRARFYSGPSQHFDFALAPVAWGISRASLDTALAERFRQLGGELLEGSELQDLGPDVVDARGRPTGSGDGNWVGWKAYLEPQDAPPELGEVDLIMLPVPGGYAGLSRIEDGRVSMGLVARSDARIPDLLVSHPILALRAEFLRAHASIAQFNFKAYPGPRRIGDTRRVWPPLVGDGMSQALGAGEALAQDLASGRSRWRPSIDLQFNVARSLHTLMLTEAPRRAAAALCRTFPSVPAAIYKFSRG